jgi:Domain of unknown function (DUF4276)
LPPPTTIACVVEGHGEKEAVPTLLRRIAAEIAPGLHIWLPPPYRINRSKLMMPGELEKAVGTQANRVDGGGGVLVLVDADDDCPATFGPALLARAQATRRDRMVAVVLAKHEFEAWFLASAASLAGHRGLPATLQPPPDAEAVRGAKEWLNRARSGRPYKETSDQAALAALFDMAVARKNAPSFDKLWRETERLLRG